MSVKHSPRVSVKHTPRELIGEVKNEDKVSNFGDRVSNIAHSPARISNISQIHTPGRGGETSPVASTNSRLNNGPVQHSPPRNDPFSKK